MFSHCRKWTAKAIQEFRERKVAKDTVVKAEATSAEGAQGKGRRTAALSHNKFLGSVRKAQKMRHVRNSRQPRQ
eukprot:g10498.t1